MLRAVYKHAQSDNRILDVSVEDPSPDFQVSLFSRNTDFTPKTARYRAREEERERERERKREREKEREEGEKETKERCTSNSGQGHNLMYFDGWCIDNRLFATS